MQFQPIFASSTNVTDLCIFTLLFFRFGRKKILVICPLLFTIFGLIAAFSVNVIMYAIFHCLLSLTFTMYGAANAMGKLLLWFYGPYMVTLLGSNTVKSNNGGIHTGDYTKHYRYSIVGES